MSHTALHAHHRTVRLKKLQKAQRRQIPAWLLMLGGWALFLGYLWFRSLHG